MRALLLAALVLAAPLALAGNAAYDPAAAWEDHTGFNTQRKIARAADGAVHYAYVDADEDGATRVRIVRSLHGDETILPSPTFGGREASRPSIVVDDAGTLHAAWTERADDDREVFHARFADGAWRDVAQLSGGVGYAGFPSLAVGPDGALHVAWYGYDGAHYQTFYRELPPGGAWRDAVQLSSGTIDSNNPNVLVDASGAVHVVWYKDDGRTYAIWHARRAPDGAWDHPQRLSRVETDAFNAALALDARGIVHAVWDELRDRGYVIVHATLREGAWSEPAVIADAAVGGQYPAISRWRDGVLVAWTGSEGALLGTDLSGAPRALLGGAHGRHPALRGGLPFPRSESAETLDVVYGTREGDAWRVRHVAIPPECSPFDAPGACGARRETSAPPWPLVWIALGLAAWHRPFSGRHYSGQAST